MRVVDASAMVNVLMGTAAAPALLQLLDDDLFAPDLLVPEVLRALHHGTLAGLISAATAEQASAALADAPLEYVASWPRHDRIWQLRHRVSIYDACYVALAEDLRVPLVTSDRRLARTASVWVTVLTDESTGAAGQW